MIERRNKRVEMRRVLEKRKRDVAYLMPRLYSPHLPVSVVALTR